MDKQNGSSITEFIMLGFSSDPDVEMYLFFLFFLIYIITVTGNVVLIILWVADGRLHTPMYFFLVNLALVDVCLSSVIVPKMLVQFLLSKKISYSGCVTQGCTALVFGVTESVLLTVMAYDRYVAISAPLRYTVIMNKYTCITLVAFCWLVGIVVSVTSTMFAIQLILCQSNIINHVHCEVTVFIKLACSDTSVTEIIIFSLGMLVLPLPSLIILVSYTCIIVTIMTIRSSEGRRKAFSTCSSHFIVVTMFYSTAIFDFLRPASKNMDNKDKIISLFYTVTPPLVNPMIYSLRNKDVKMALLKVTQKISFH